MIKSSNVKRGYALRCIVLALFITCFTVLCAVSKVSIYDIQFTMDAGFDGTYPSPYLNQTVMIEGVVTAIGFENNRIFVSMPAGGAWSAICVETSNRNISVGNLIEVQGRVSEVMGMTTLTNTQNLRILQRSTPLPNPVTISVNEALTNEAYEAVLVRVTNVRCTAKQNGNFIATIEDTTDSIFIGNGFNANIADTYFTVGNQYQYIIGIVNFSFGRFTIHPRSGNDIARMSVGHQSTSWGKIKSLYK